MLIGRTRTSSENTFRVWLGTFVVVASIASGVAIQASDAVHAHHKARVSKTVTTALVDSKGKQRDASSPSVDEVALLKEKVAHLEQLLTVQQQQIEKLTAAQQERQQILDQPSANEHAGAVGTTSIGPYATLRPVLPAMPSAKESAALAALPPQPNPAGSDPVTHDEFQGYAAMVDQLGKSLEKVNKGLAGFNFGGTFRFRTDGIFRSGNQVAGPVQNIRERYRLRFNLDKSFNDQFSFHIQVGSGRFDNQITDDTDFAGIAARGLIFLSEASVNWHPTGSVQIQAGRQREVFDDAVRFMWDDDLRLNGAHEIVGTDLGDNALRIRHLELKAGQYILSNPNVAVLPSAAACAPTKPQVITSLPTTITPSTTLPANCAYLAAGFNPGGKVRDANLFDQGFQFNGDIKEGWSHYLFGNVQLYRNANEIQLASTPAGLPLLVNSYFGLNLNGPFGGTGNGTTTPGGPIYTASHFQIGRLGYRITRKGWKVGEREMPVSVDVEGSRNFGTSFLRNAWEATLIVGDVTRRGDVRFLYSYAFKGANSMISQFTDDHLGTLTGVNNRTHLIRLDIGLTRFLQWQNFLYIQEEVSSNDPKRNFFVPIPAGAATTYRAQSELLFAF